MQLRNDDTLGAVDDERTLFGHIRDRAKIYILERGLEILMIGIGAVELQLGLERHTVGQTAVQALVD